MGKYGRPHFTAKNGTFKLHDITDKKAIKTLNDCVNYLISDLPKKLKKTDTDLLNIRDEILADINKARYLFTLK